MRREAPFDVRFVELIQNFEREEKPEYQIIKRRTVQSKEDLDDFKVIVPDHPERALRFARTYPYLDTLLREKYDLVSVLSRW